MPVDTSGLARWIVIAAHHSSAAAPIITRKGFKTTLVIVVLHWIRMEQLAICQLVAGRFDGTVGQHMVARKRAMAMANRFENIRAATGDV
jgi:hypothetical protein